jgi:histidinol-phosphate phosphatase family protein
MLLESGQSTVFLDRDGVINERAPEGDYVRRWEDFRFIAGTVDTLRALTARGHRLIVVTNQRGVARGLMSQETVDDIHRRMISELAAAKVRISAVYYCPHEQGTCDCRKPKPGMLYRAQSEFPDIDLAHAFVVGDTETDVMLGSAVGAATILLGVERPLRMTVQPTFVATSLREALANGYFDGNLGK